MNERNLKIAAALVMTAPFIPMLFQGEEWGASTPFLYFTGHEDEELGQAVSEGRKREFVSFGWKADEIPDPQALDSFVKSKLDWNEKACDPHRALLEWHRELIRLRKGHPDFNDSRLDQLTIEFDEQARWLMLIRGSSLVVCNFSAEPQQIAVPAGIERRCIVMVSDDTVRQSGGTLSMPAESVAILSP
jgi:maltooligosyltrehalose trehalohydrolase